MLGRTCSRQLHNQIKVRFWAYSFGLFNALMRSDGCSWAPQRSWRAVLLRGRKTLIFFLRSVEVKDGVSCLRLSLQQNCEMLKCLGQGVRRTEEPCSGSPVWEFLTCELGFFFSFCPTADEWLVRTWSGCFTKDYRALTTRDGNAFTMGLPRPNKWRVCVALFYPHDRKTAQCITTEARATKAFLLRTHMFKSLIRHERVWMPFTCCRY